MQIEHDTIFRIYSLTKPIVTVAALILYEEGQFLLSDPIAKFIPEFANVQVFDAEASDGSSMAPLDRPITILDLLMHTSGLIYGWGGAPVDSLYRNSNLMYTSDEQGRLVRDGTMHDMVEKLVQLPLVRQPGSEWEYSLSHDVLGYLIEVVSDRALDEFLRERIVEPLDMPDTGFEVPREALNRLAVSYRVNDDGDIQVEDAGLESIFAAPVDFHSGGGGLVPTVPDYLRFAQMILNGGILGGTRLLSRESVELMTTNHLRSLRIGIKTCRSLRPDKIWFNNWIVGPTTSTILPVGNVESVTSRVQQCHLSC